MDAKQIEQNQLAQLASTNIGALQQAPLQLARKQPESLEPSVGQMMEAFIARGITTDNVAAFERLVALKERMDDKDAERQFNAAFVKLQSELPVIVAKTIIPNRGKYERFEDVMSAISGPLQANGFSVSFSQDFKENRIVETCTLRHIAGYSQANSFAVRAGGKADSDTQSDCKASTTAKRNALLNCLNIVIRQDIMQNEDADASLEGGYIGDEKVQYLKEQVKETGSNEARFLEMAGVKSYDEITNGSYGVLVRALAAKSKRA